jgi:hypothetical protein
MSLCPISDCPPAVEVGSSRMVVRLLFLTVTMSRAFVVHATCQRCKVNDDEDYKIVFAYAGGWRRWVVVLPCARFFAWTWAGEIPVNLFGPNVVPPSSGIIPSWRASWESPIHFTLQIGGNPRTG